MKKPIGLFVCMALTGFAYLVSCKTQQPVAATTCKSQDLVVDDAFEHPENNAPFTVEKHTLEGDILTLFVSYSGGCADHDFKLVFNGMYMKSLPPKANFILFHDAHDDACRSVVNDTLCFNIKGVREKDRTTGEVIVKVSGLDGVINYKY